jgi:hypothetical protein
MNNKLRNIQLANILLEQKYLREQTETKTGTTTTTGVTQTTGSTQTPPSNQQPSKPNLTEPQKKDLEKKVKDNALLRCVGKPQFVVKIGDKNIHSNDNGKTFCIG